MVWDGVGWCGMVWDGVGWCGVVWGRIVWDGVGWCGVIWGGVGWCGVVWGGIVWNGVGFVPVVVWVLNVFGHLLRPGLSGCLVGGREELNSTLLDYSYTTQPLLVQ